MSFLDSIKGAFVETIPDTIGIPVKPTEKTKTSLDVTAVAVPVPNTYSSVLDPEAKKNLQTELNQSVPKTWTDLQNQISTLKKVLPDEISAYKAGLALLQQQGISYDQVLNDIQSVIDALDGKKQDFDAKATDKLNQQVGAKQKNLEDISNKRKDFEAQLAALSSQESEESSAIAVIKSKISQAQQKFLGAYNSIHKELVDEKNKISAYGGNSNV